jgi:hypothetical protein
MKWALELEKVFNATKVDKAMITGNRLKYSPRKGIVNPKAKSLSGSAKVSIHKKGALCNSKAEPRT